MPKEIAVRKRKSLFYPDEGKKCIDVMMLPGKIGF